MTHTQESLFTCRKACILLTRLVSAQTAEIRPSQRQYLLILKPNLAFSSLPHHATAACVPRVVPGVGLTKPRRRLLQDRDWSWEFRPAAYGVIYGAFYWVWSRVR